MPFDGSGNYTRVHDWTTDRDANIKIQASRMDAEMDDQASAFNQVLLRTGVAAMTGNLDMGQQKITDLASGSAAAPAVQFNADATTGIYLAASGRLAISANGTERLHVDTAGAAVTGTLEVFGDFNISAGATIGGFTTVATYLTVGTTFTVTGASTLNGAVTVNNTLGVTGTLTGAGATFTSLSVGGSSVIVASNLLTNILSVDGSGSGIDADLLDGLQGSAYQTVSGLLAAIQSIDGAGSSIDADLLDGLQGAEYAVLAAGTNTFTGQQTISGNKIVWSGNASFGGTNSGYGQIYHSTVNGLVISGEGTSYDLTVTNKTGNANFRILTGSTSTEFVGKLSVGAASMDASLGVTAADGTYQLGLAGTSKGIRLRSTSSDFRIEAVDNTLTASFQPLWISGSNVQFGTDSTERMRLTSTGLGIGVTPSYPLETTGGVDAFRFTSTGSYLFGRFRNTGGTAQTWAFSSDGTKFDIYDETGVFTAMSVKKSGQVEARAFTENVYTVTGTTPALDPANGGIQTWTLTGNSTPTDSFSNGESMLLMVNDGTAYTITWPTMTWVGGSAPTLDTTKYTVISLWKAGGVLYGSYGGAA